MRFRYSLIPSRSEMYSKPDSISSWSSLMLVAVLHIQPSSFIICRIFSRCTYLRVVFRSRCPMSSAVSIVSLYFQYLMVANQCLKSYSLIVSSVGSLVRLASLFRICRYASPYFLDVPLNSFSFGVSLYFMMCWISDLVRFGGIISVLAHPFLAVFGLIALCSVSKSRTYRF